MGFDWKSAVKTVAPWIGTALGGPVGGMAAKAVSMALLGHEDGTPEQLSTAVQTASADQMLALKSADNDFKLRCKELGFKKLKALVADKDSARKMQMATKAKTPAILAYIQTVMVCGILIGLFLIPIPPENKATIYLMLGTVTTVWLGGQQFFHGATIKEE